MDKTLISWTDRTHNEWAGCTKVSPGCVNCYAKDWGNRFGVEWGPTGTRRLTSPANRRKPFAWNKQKWGECPDCGWRGDILKTFMEGDQALICPHCHMHVVNPTRQRVFCSSLADVFEDWQGDILNHKGEVTGQTMADVRLELFATITATPNIDWLLLTKRIENVMAMIPAAWQTALPDNVWLGTTTENQAMADKRIPELSAIPAKTKFLSIEPMLGPINIVQTMWDNELSDGDIQWVIGGGESGPNARPMNPDWARALRDQCIESGIPFHFKQWGEWLPFKRTPEASAAGGYRAANGQLLTISEFINVPHTIVDDDGIARVGKKAAGHLLDGVEWKQFPVVAR